MRSYHHEPRKKRSKINWTRHTSLVMIGICMTVMVVSFQNFTGRLNDIPLDLLKPRLSFASARLAAARHVEAENLKSGRSAGDIRNLVPNPPQQIEDRRVLVMPDSGSDLQSVGQNWAVRQSEVLTGGAEKRLLEDINHSIQKFFQPEAQNKYKNGIKAPYSKEGRRPAQANSANQTNQNTENTGTDPDPSLEESSITSGKSLRFSRINRLELDWSEETQISCAVETGGMQWDLSQRINSRIDVNLRHKALDESSSLQLKYNW